MVNNPQIKSQYNVTISGPVSGQVAVGRGIRQIYQSPAAIEPDPANQEVLRQALAALREQVAASAPPEKQPAALERVDELAEAVAAPEPDLTTMEYVRNWFVRNLPGLAGSVMAVIVNPIVGRLVEAAGDGLVAEFQRRFGVE